METRWRFKSNLDSELISDLQDQLGVNPIIAQLLVQRGVSNFDEAKVFFRPEINHLHDPFLMKEMSIAVQRLEFAIGKGERILVYGDYDVDGTTAVSMMYSFIKGIHPRVEYYIPDRYSEGYGISYKAIDFAEENNYTLIICLDCGIKAIKKISYATDKGIDFIICDHHRPGDEIPAAAAVLNPKQIDCKYPYKELSACGVGFKLIQAYCQKNKISFEEIISFLDLVVVSIAADIVPMTGENRVLAYHGLQQLNANPRLGIKKLMELSYSDKKDFNINDVLFGLAPRINAAGRIKHGKKAVELLVETNESIARNKAEKINDYNLSRRELDQTITKEALEMILPNNKSTVVFHSEWHKGVVGIVASRLIEKYYRPTIVLTESNGSLTGSARSVKGFDIYKAIESCSDLLDQFGGHKFAAGLTMKKANLEEFKKKFEAIVSSTITNEMLIPEISIDSEINITDIDIKLYRIIQQMSPFGPGNMPPCFITKSVTDRGYGKKVGQDQSHLKLTITDLNHSIFLEGIGFKLGDKFEQIKDGQLFDICYSLEENEWNGQKKLQLKLKDIR